MYETLMYKRNVIHTLGDSAASPYINEILIGISAKFCFWVEESLRSMVKSSLINPLGHYVSTL